MRNFYYIYEILSKKEKRYIYLLALMAIVNTVLETVGVAAVIPLLTALLEPKLFSEKIGIDVGLLGNYGVTESETFTVGVAIFFILYLVKNVYSMYFTSKQSKFIYNLQSNLSTKILENYIYKPYKYHVENNSSKLIQTVINETNTLTHTAIIPGFLFATESMVMIAILLCIFIYEPIGALLIFLVFGLPALIYHLSIGKKLEEWGLVRIEADQMKLRVAKEILLSIREVKLSGQESFFIDKFTKESLASAQVSNLQGISQSVPKYLFELAAVVGLILIMVEGFVKNNTSSQIVITVALFGTAAFRLMPSINRIFNSIGNIRFSTSTILNIYNDALISEKKDAVRESNIVFNNTLRLDNVSLSYDGGDNYVLTDINIEIRKGEILGIIGVSGAGKTSLINLILGLIEPSAGKIKIDGVPVDIFDKKGWMSKIAYVPQGTYIFDDTFKRNITFGESEVDFDSERFKYALKVSCLDSFIESLPQKELTRVGEDAVNISGGQKQRLGIARAVYQNRDIYIFDEATSALDMETERSVLVNLTNNIDGKTIIFITHRISSTDICNRIYTIKSGQAFLKNNNV